MRPNRRIIAAAKADNSIKVTYYTHDACKRYTRRYLYNFKRTLRARRLYMRVINNWLRDNNITTSRSNWPSILARHKEQHNPQYQQMKAEQAARSHARDARHRAEIGAKAGELLATTLEKVISDN